MKTVKVTVAQQDTIFHFRGVNSVGHTVDMDDHAAYESGNGSGATPMEVLVMALGACSGLDIADILKKGKQTMTSFDMDVVGKKPAGVSPSVFQTIHISYRFEGPLDEKKARRAIDLSLSKYCSVARTLEKTASISYDFTLNGTFHEGTELP
jgi:putative redox protein